LALDPESFLIPYKYVAFLEEEYFIKNEMPLWEEICKNGLFDVWVPDAPSRRFKECKSNPSNFRILLLKIHEIDEEFHKNEIASVSDRIDHIIGPNLRVTLKKPVVEYREFQEIKDLLETSIGKFLKKPLREEPLIKGIIESQKCEHCGHHEIGILSESGKFKPLKPGTKVVMKLDS
jgi:hypothetical protein